MVLLGMTLADIARDFDETQPAEALDLPDVTDVTDVTDAAAP